MLKKNLFLVSIIALIMISSQIFAQDVVMPEERKSPVALASIKTDKGYAKVVYGQPFKKERVIYGDLVPYGKVWRTGANEATEITFAQDVSINDVTIEKGTYTLFTIPNEEGWTLILNSELGQWGAYRHDESKDTAVIENFTATSTLGGTSYEALTMKFDEASVDTVNLNIMWDQTVVVIPIQFL